MPGEATKLGPFAGGLHNASGSGEFIENDELYELVNMEVDTDGSLANRPEIKKFYTSGWQSYNASFIGTYIPSDGRKYVVAYSPSTTQVFLIDATTGVASANTPTGMTSVACIQYANKLWVVATTSSSINGGYFDAPTGTTLTWTTVASMPRGESMALYRERLWIGCGLGATSNTSRFFYSAVADGTNWAANDWNDVAAGNGQKLVSLVRLGNDLILFKEHSTHKFTYTTDPRKAEINEIDATIGVPAINCVVVYNNNIIYALHDNAVYELFQLSFSRISAIINMDQETDLDLFSKDQYGLTIHRDRLFVRYFKNLYVYSLRVKKWTSWETLRKFSKVVVIPSATVGLDTAYCTTASQANPTDTYYFIDSRETNDAGQIQTMTPTQVGASTLANTGATTCVITPHASSAAGDWLYIMLSWSWISSSDVITIPGDFVPLTTRQRLGVIGAGTGVEYQLFRKKKLAGETTYTITFPTSRASSHTCITVRGSTDNPPVMGTLVNTRAAANPSLSNFVVPSDQVANNSIMLGFFVNFFGTNTQLGTPTWTGAIASAGADSNNATSKLQHFAGVQTKTSGLTMGPMSVGFALADQGNVGYVPVLIPVVDQSTTPDTERFQGRLTTKTYDFDVPHAYKVSFMWGVSVATSGKTIASLVIPNATRNSTWRQIRDKYGTWPAAQAAGVRWSNNVNVVVPDTVLASLGKYSRKYLKLLKKVRFRQIYFTLVFDVITNNGIADASLRLYDLTCFVKKKETVVKETS